MSLKIRLRQQGRKNHRFYRIVVMDGRIKSDGKSQEMVGWYDPYQKEDERVLSLNTERVKFWVDQGAEMSEKVASLVARRVPEINKAKKAKAVADRAKACAKRKQKKKAAVAS